VIWHRSWPTDDELRERHCTRPHVVDRLPRLLMSAFDYRTVERWPADPAGFCMLEWDVALDQPSRARFARAARSAPGRVLVAPYWYGAMVRLPDVPDRQDTAEAFGFGCIYFPQPILRAAVDHFDSTGCRMTDETFSAWHLEHHGPARVTWDVQPQHLREF